MPQDPDTLISDPTKFLIEKERQRRHVHEMFKSRAFMASGDPILKSAPDLPPRLEGDELVAWVRSGLAIEQKIFEHEIQGITALTRRGLSLEEWQIDPDGHIVPRQSKPSSSGTTPPTETAEPTLHSDH